MFPNYLNKEKLHEFIRIAIREDHGDGDHTSLGSIKEDKKVQAHLLFKEEGIVEELRWHKLFLNVFQKYFLSHLKKMGTNPSREVVLRYLEMRDNC